jgi:thiamine biosynthesis lipoprotein
MDTVVSVEVVTARPEDETRAAIARALGWFAAVEWACSRFDRDSELRRLSAHIGTPVPASPIVFEAVRFAIALADRTGGAFDPAVGHVLEAKGFDRDYVTGTRVAPDVPSGGCPTFRDVRLDIARRTITLLRPLVLDLGAVAKGLAIDLAARELAAFESCCVEAGGDLYARGRNAHGKRWRIGVQDPRTPDALVCRFGIANQAVCTSGDYERRTATGDEHHLVDPRTGRSADALASVTVLAPTAMAADGLATAAFVLGPDRGRRLLEDEGVAGILVAPSGAVRTTRGAPARVGTDLCAQSSGVGDENTTEGTA